MGLNEHSTRLYIIDFGLAKRYRDPKTRLHIPYGQNIPLIGTTSFASINTHLGHEQSRRDDLESVVYLLIYLIRGALPWYKPRSKTQHLRAATVLKRKMSPTPEICRGCPNEVKLLLNYTRTLGFTDKPDYIYLRGLLANMLERENDKSTELFERRDETSD
jgi:serine/threonine protein kinase